MTLKSYVLMCALAFSAVLSANPLALPEYTREVKLTFATPEAAKEAKLTLLPLPAGKHFAFSTRWDDSNPKHARMAELLAKHGFKGTFFLVARDDKFYDETLPQLTRKGHSVGNHTLNHPNLATLIPNEVSRQICRTGPNTKPGPTSRSTPSSCRTAPIKTAATA
ncbi:MAG: polysaccharide deacetylase family protein [Victivallis sp.]